MYVSYICIYGKYHNLGPLCITKMCLNMSHLMLYLGISLESNVPSSITINAGLFPIYFSLVLLSCYSNNWDFRDTFCSLVMCEWVPWLSFAYWSAFEKRGNEKKLSLSLKSWLILLSRPLRKDLQSHTKLDRGAKQNWDTQKNVIHLIIEQDAVMV